MQLYAFMESLEKHIANLSNVYLIYRSSNDHYDDGYEIVFDRFPYIQGHKQGKNPTEDFKPLTLKCVFDKKSRAPYIMFAVDDIIMTDFVDLEECTSALKKYGSWFFSLRLGHNITRASLNRADTGRPNGKVKQDQFFIWRFDDPTAKGGWAYPNSVDVTIYRKKDIKKFLKEANYRHPNTLESIWFHEWKPKRKLGLSYLHSKAVNLPLNVVDTFANNPHLNLTVQGLLNKFLSGYKIDVDHFREFNNDAPHMMVEPKFMRR